MGTYRLNLSALRRPKGAQRSERTPARQPSTDRLVVSRREMLGLAGAAAIGLSPVAKAVEASVIGPFDCVVRRGRVSFRLSGTDRWVIDTRRFAGSPDLTVAKSDGLINVKLSNARYPGTDLPADLTCEIRRGIVGWQMTLKMKLDGFRASVPFERWLTGRETAKSRVALDHLVCDLDPQSSLATKGRAEAVFCPDWSFSVNGPNVARLSIEDQLTAADFLSISLLGSGEQSLVTKPAPNRSLVTLKRGSADWPSELFLNDVPDDWGRSTQRCAFDSISLELGEHKTGLPQRTLLAESLDDETRLHVSPLSVPFSLPLRDIRYSTTFGKTENHTALLARFGSEPAWLHADGCSLQLGDSPHAAELEITRFGQKHPNVSCAPALLAIVAPLIGAVTTTARPTKPTNVDVTGRAPVVIRRAPAAPAAPETRKPDTTTVRPPVRVIKPDEGRVIVKPIEKTPIILLPFNLKVSVVRPSDLLVLEFEFVNLKYTTGTPPSLVRNDAKTPAYIIVHFPPQNIAERAFYESVDTPKDNEPPTSDPVPTRMAGPSRLVFRVPDKTAAVPYTLDALLDWTQYEPSLVPVALPPPQTYQVKVPVMSQATVGLEMNRSRVGATGRSRSEARTFSAAAVRIPQASLLIIREPRDTQTSIEAPYRLVLSPHAGEAWAHSPDAITVNGRTELWHTRLGVRNDDGTIDESDSPSKTLRPVWSPDYNPDSPPDSADMSPFRTGITRRQRHQIVGLSSDFGVSGYDPLPVHAKSFMLSSLGAWIDTRGVWDPRKIKFDVCEWKHNATMGRDHYVKVVEMGYLFPYGYLAVKTTITERKFEPVGRKIGAYLRQKMFITVLRPVVEYPVPNCPNMMNEIPFQRVQCVTLVTPDLGKPQSSAVPGTGIDAFWPVYGSDAFRFHMVGEDWDGRHSEFEAAVIFVVNSAAFDQSKLGYVSAEYLDNKNQGRRMTDLRGQRVAFAQSNLPGDTSYETHEVEIGGNVPAGPFGSAAVLENMSDDYRPPFYPTLVNANVKIAALQQLVGNDSLANISYGAAYKSFGFGAQNKGEVFVALKDAVGVDFGGSPDKSCGVAAPNMSIGSISRGLGPVGGKADDIAGGSFDPMTFFKDAMILGSIPLTSILDAIPDFGSLKSAGAKIPMLSSRPIYPQGQAMPNAIETSFNWETSGIHNDTLTETFLASANGQHSSLMLSAVKRTALDGGESTQIISGELRNFTIQLVPKIMHLADIVFNYLRFSCENGKKPDVKADIAKVKFVGCLEFINPFEEFMGGSSFSDPPFLDVSSDGVVAGFTLPIPTVAIGVFSLQNINLGAALKVPFIGQPVSMRFNFCERQDPFMLTVSLFAGGGYFALEVDPSGVRKVEGSIEFGGSFALNLGVASGGVYVMAGVAYSRSGDQTKLGGYLRCGGSLEVLGLITVSLEFVMTLEHISPPSRLHGIATLTVEIEILFFSTSVDLTVEREFGGGGDPLFKDLMAESDWGDYCDAFAA